MDKSINFFFMAMQTAFSLGERSNMCDLGFAKEIEIEKNEDCKKAFYLFARAIYRFVISKEREIRSEINRNKFSLNSRL